MSTGSRSKARKRATSTPAAPRHLAAGLEPDTALLCTEQDFPGELAAHYPEACVRLDLPPRAEGYALRLAQDTDGALDGRGARRGLRLGRAVHARDGNRSEPGRRPGDIEHVLPGWPVVCSLGLADRCTPHDPPGSARVLRPTQPLGWAPTMRRVMADAIARELLEPVDAGSRELAWLDLGLNPADQPARVVDLATRPLRPEHEPAVSAALDQARAMAREGAPPGAVRAGDHPILVRATSDTWSLAARPRNGPALLLLDEIPGCALEISGTEGLDQTLANLAGADPLPRSVGPLV